MREKEGERKREREVKPREETRDRSAVVSCNNGWRLEPGGHPTWCPEVGARGVVVDP